MIIVIDTETTGLVKAGCNDFLAQPGIVQIAAQVVWEDCDDRGDKFVAWHAREFQSLVNPEMQINPEAQRVHGISQDDVKDAPTFFEVLPRLAGFFMGARAWAGYNTKFDRDVLYYQLQRYGFERNFPWPLEEIDVMKLAGAHLNGQGKRGQDVPKLTEAYKAIFNEEMPDAHDAMGDVRGTARILMELRK